jgi:hypothetical protein
VPHSRFGGRFIQSGLQVNYFQEKRREIYLYAIAIEKRRKLRDILAKDEGQGEKNKSSYGIGIENKDIVAQPFQSGCFE